MSKAVLFPVTSWSPAISAIFAMIFIFASYEPRSCSNGMPIRVPAGINFIGTKR
jgi:hypothetical protein